MLRAVLMEEKRRKSANACKSHLGVLYCLSGKTVKASAICIPPIASIKPRYDETVLSVLYAYLTNNQKHYVEQF